MARCRGIRSLLLLLLSTLAYTTAAAVSSYSEITPFRNVMTKHHNNLRSEHNASALIWDVKLEENARDVANTCVFEHSGGPYGENIAAGQRTPEDVCKNWGIDEREKYDFLAGDYGTETGHFTQMVWKGTKRFGCAAVSCNGILGYGVQWYTVCEYDPPGNVMGLFRENVIQGHHHY